MASRVSFGDAHSSFQANIINGSVHNEFHGGPENLLSRLPYAEDAPFNSYAKQHESICLRDTRVDLLDEIQSWADGPDERCIFWLSGLAGTGKSTIARTIARRYFDKQCLAASFFFSRGGGDVGHAGRFVTSIAVQIAQNVPASRQHICEAVAERNDIVRQSLHDQWQHLVCGPLSKLQKSGPYIVVVDALDECDNDNNIRIIVQLLAKARWLGEVRLRVFVTSRPEVPIRHGFKQMADAEHKDVVLHDISPSIVDHDIAAFLKHNFNIIASEYHLHTKQSGTEVIKQLVQSAGGIFIWATTACRFIRDGKHFAAKRLETILCADSATIAAPEKHLNQLYITVLNDSLSKEFTNEETEEHCKTLRYILGSVVVLLSPLSQQSLNKLLYSTDEEIGPTLGDLHAILNIPGDLAKPIRLHHPSFRDFLLSKDRCGDEKFWVDEKSIHEKLAFRCLELMSAPDGLRQDICNLSALGAQETGLKEDIVAGSLPPELQYACRYWVAHLERSQHSIADGDTVDVFLQTHLLHWLEAMSLMEETSHCVGLVARLQALVVPSSDACGSFLLDTNRFLQRFCWIIAESPLQVYSSAMVFSPEKSLVRKRFVHQIPQTVEMICGRETDWDACQSVLEGHSDWVTAVVFSPDGQLVASASSDKTVRVWETATGTCRSILEGHLGDVMAVAFSSDGELVASVSWDKTVRLWETETGTCRSVLEGHLGDVTAVVFSPDGKLVASSSRDKTVRVWETMTGTCRSILGGHSRPVTAVAFSSDGQIVASASSDRTARLWDTMMGTQRSELEGHSGYVTAVVFSPDGQMVASASDDMTVRVWDTTMGTCRSILKGHSGDIMVTVFSPDGQLVASASRDKTVRVWELATGTCRIVLEGQSPYINRLTFSPDFQVLHSDRWDIRLPSSSTRSSSAVSHEDQLSHLFVDDQWVLCNTQRMLLLPSGYRSYNTAVFKDMACLGCRSGRVALLKLQ